MAVVIGEAAVQVRADASGTADEIEQKVVPAAEAAGDEGGAALGEKLKLAAAAGLAGLGLAFAESLEREALGDKLAAQLGGSEEYAAEMGAIAGDLYANAYGDSLGTVNDALRNVLQSGLLPEDATNDQIESITAKALSLATAFDQDVAGAANAAGRMVQTGLAANAEQAMDILTRGFQQGADAGGDLLDVLSEYGTTFSELGVDGPMAVGLIDQALAAGIPNADFAADALREIGIIGRTAGEGAATALESLGINADQYFSAMQEGGPAAASAMDNMLDVLRSTEDPALRAAAAAELVGTQYEDFGDTILSLDPSTAAAGLGEIEGAATNLDATLSGNAQTSLTSFWREAQTAFVDVLGGQVIPIISTVVGWLRDQLGPTFSALGGFISGTVVPALQSLAGWVAANEGPLTVVGAIIGAVLIPALIRLAAQAIVSGLTTLAGWAMSVAGAVGAGAAYVAQSALIVGRWILMAATAVAQGAVMAGVWVAQVVASAVSGAASFAVAVARVVAGWVLMGAQSLLAAARIAAAWLIAMGPIGWIIAAVVGLVAIIIANWDTIKNATVAVFEAIWGFIQGIWNAVVGFITGAIDAVVGFITGGWTWLIETTTAAWQWFGELISGAIEAVVGYVTGIPARFVAGLQALGSMIAGVAGAAWDWFKETVVSKVGDLISFVGSIPGRIVSGLGNLGGLLVSLGGDLIGGLVDGIANAASFVGNVAKNIVNGIIGFINNTVIDGMNDFLEFSIMGVSVNPPDIPHIPRLHSGGIFDSGSGEGLALLRDQERVITPEQRVIADTLLADLLGGTLSAASAAGATVGGAQVNVAVYPEPGVDSGVLATQIGAEVGWRLSARTAPAIPLTGG